MIIDDHPIVRDGLKMMMQLTSDLTVVASATDGIDARKKLVKLSNLPDVILVDLQMPHMIYKETCLPNKDCCFINGNQ